MNQDVFRAILAMDSYNRGYNAALNVSGSALGCAQLLSHETYGINAPAYANWQSKGFFAAVYDWDDEIVISFRGTDVDLDSVQDFLATTASDIYNGWSLGAGFSSASQAGLAVEFYKAVAGVTSPYYTIDSSADPITLVGHSLGGGLAGFVSGLSGQLAFGYDHMPFGVATYAQSVSDSIAAAVASTGITIPDLIAATISAFIPGTVISGTVTIQDFLDAFESEFVLRTPGLGMIAVYTEGEVLEAVRNGVAEVFFGTVAAGSLQTLLQEPLLTALVATTGVALGLSTYELENLASMSTSGLSTYNADFGNPLTDPLERHSMPLLVTLLYGEEQWTQEATIGHWDKWSDAAASFLPTLLSDSIGTAVGFVKDDTGTGDSGDQMAMAIAYSAINQGTTVFGDVAIVSLFDDASDLGFGLTHYSVPEALTAAASGIGEIITQYAGKLAFDKAVSTTAGLSDGVLQLISDTETPALTLTIDLREQTWGNAALNAGIVGASKLIEGFISSDSNSSVTTSGQVVFNDIVAWFDAEKEEVTDPSLLRSIDRISIGFVSDYTIQAITGDRILLTVLPDGYSSGYAMDGEANFVIGGNGSDTIFGLSGNDILIGGESTDWIEGGDNNDFIYGGSGSDILYGQDGDDRIYSGGEIDPLIVPQDFLYGGSGNDVLIFADSTGIAEGGTGNDVIDARTASGDIEIMYRLGDGSDSIDWSYDFDVTTTTYANFSGRNFDCRNIASILFEDIYIEDVYIVWDAAILDGMSAGSVSTTLYEGSFRIYDRNDNLLMDVGSVVGSHSTDGESYGTLNFVNLPALIFTDYEFQTGAEGAPPNIEIHIPDIPWPQERMSNQSSLQLFEQFQFGPDEFAAFGRNVSEARGQRSEQFQDRVPTSPYRRDENIYGSQMKVEKRQMSAFISMEREVQSVESAVNQLAHSSSISDQEIGRRLAIWAQDMASFGVQNGESDISWRRESIKPVEYFA